MTSTPDTQQDRVVAYCTASTYKTRAMFDAFKEQYRATLYRDAVHFSIKDHDIFCFAYGVAIFWGLTKSEEKYFLEKFKPFEYVSLDTVEEESMFFAQGSAPKIEEDTIILPNTETVSRLAVSFGLAQSVKLVVFENTIQRTIDTTKTIPEQLAMKGKIPLSRKEIRQKMGELFLERSSINLHFNVLDVPEFFWEYSEYEPLYVMIAKHLDLEARGEILNQRLDIVHDLFEMLANELNHQHSSRLEWIIIWLIAVEAIMSFTHGYL